MKNWIKISTNLYICGCCQRAVAEPWCTWCGAKMEDAEKQAEKHFADVSKMIKEKSVDSKIF